jgi:hypothetical protein
LILTLAKYASWKQIDQALLTFKPFWKPKILFARIQEKNVLDGLFRWPNQTDGSQTEKLKRIKTMEGLTDKGRYLCITAEDFKDYEESKVPVAFLTK